MSTADRAELGATWGILVEAARARRKLTYGEVARTIGGIARGVGALLRPLEGYCASNGLPPLTSLVVRKSDGVPSTGFGVGGDPAAHQRHVWDFDWNKVANPYA